MATILLILYVLNVLCATVQLMPVVTVPVSRPSRHLTLSRHNNFAFGVFGICDVEDDWCSPVSVGYGTINLTRPLDPLDVYVGDMLPSPTIHAVSQLLIMHVVAFATSEMSALSLAALIIMQTYTRWRWRRNNSGSSPSNLHAQSQPTEVPVAETSSCKFNSVPYLNLAFAFSLLSFFSTLLAFLADAILFTPHLGVLIWIQAIPIIIFSIIVTLLCFMRRTVIWKRNIDKYDRQDHAYGHRPTSVIDSLFVDSASDDGFYVFANGMDSLDLPYRPQSCSSRSSRNGSHNVLYSQSQDSLSDTDAYGDEESYFSVIQYDDDIPLQFLQPPTTEGRHHL